MSFTQNFAFLLTVLPELRPHHSGQESMVTVSLSGEDKFCPELVQVIDNKDGTFMVQHLAEDTHQILSRETVRREELEAVANSAANLIERAVNMNLLWGPEYIIEYSL